MSTTHREAPDVVVVGAGVPGLAVAWRARARGLRVLVLERDEPGAGASGVAAGMLAPVTEADAQERDLLLLGLQSARRWPAFAAELRRRHRDRRRLPPDGHARRRARPRRGGGARPRARDPRAARADDRTGCCPRAPGPPSPRWPRPSAWRSTCPTTTRSTRARSSRALARPSPRPGSRSARAPPWRAWSATARARPACACGTATTVPAGAVLVAAGAWSGALGGLPTGARVPVRPVKGQTVRLRDPGTTRPGRSSGASCAGRAATSSRACDGGYVLGATVEERGFSTSMTAGAVHELLRDAAEVVPGVLELEVAELVAGPAPGDARQRAGARRLDGARRPVLGHGPPPQRDPPGAGDRRPRRRRARRRGPRARRSAPAASPASSPRGPPA